MKARRLRLLVVYVGLVIGIGGVSYEALARPAPCTLLCTNSACFWAAGGTQAIWKVGKCQNGDGQQRFMARRIHALNGLNEVVRTMGVQVERRICADFDSDPCPAQGNGVSQVLIGCKDCSESIWIDCYQCDSHQS